MKFHTLCAMMTALAWGVNGMSSNTRGQHHASLLREFHRYLDPVPADHDVGPMLRSAESMLADLASRHAGTPLADLVAKIRPFILQMQDAIRAAHNSAQQTVTNFAGDFSGCASAKSTGDSDATSLQNIKKDHSDDHKACRTQEKHAHDQFSACESNMNSLRDAKESSCQLYADAARTPGCGAIPPTPGETWKNYVTRAATWFASERDSYLHKEEVCDNDTAKLQAQETICFGSDGSGGHKKEYEDKKDGCDAIQKKLETATCSYASKVDDTCESFASCTTTVLDGYEAQLPGIQTLETQRKVEWNATERLLCMLGAYGDDGSVDATKLQTCQLIADNTSHLNLVYPTSTSRPAPCPDLPPHPCQADYISQEYGGLDAPATDCTACVIPGEGGAPSQAAQFTFSTEVTNPSQCFGTEGKNADLPTGDSAYTIEASVTVNGGGGIVWYGEKHQGAKMLGLRTSGCGWVVLEWWGHPVLQQGGFNLCDGNAHYIVTTYEPSETAADARKLYVDGTLVKSDNPFPKVLQVTDKSTFCIGDGRDFEGSLYRGTIHGVRISKTAMTSVPSSWQ